MPRLSPTSSRSTDASSSTAVSEVYAVRQTTGTPPFIAVICGTVIRFCLPSTLTLFALREEEADCTAAVHMRQRRIRNAPLPSSGYLSSRARRFPARLGGDAKETAECHGRVGTSTPLLSRLSG